MAGAGLTGEKKGAPGIHMHAHAQTAVEFHRRRVILGHDRACVIIDT